MSALPPKADIDSCECHVRFVPKADIQLTVTSKIKPPDIARGFVVGTHGQSLEAWTVVEEIAETELDFADPLPDANSL